MRMWGLNNMMGYIFLAVAAIIIFIFVYNNIFDRERFVRDISPLFKKLMEKDYAFLVNVKYGDEDIDISQLFEIRIRNGLSGLIVTALVLLLMGFNIIYLVIGLAISVYLFKDQYIRLKSYYKARIHTIDLMLPYYLKGLEILVQHYTVPIALSRSIETAPDVFKPGLRRLVAKIEEGDSSIQPYIDFANEYPVRDSMRMMRLLYRLGLGSQQDKHKQIMEFSKTVSSLQNKAREIKYADRLEHIEKQTMIMLVATGSGVLALLFTSMTVLMNV